MGNLLPMTSWKPSNKRQVEETTSAGLTISTHVPTEPAPEEVPARKVSLNFFGGFTTMVWEIEPVIFTMVYRGFHHGVGRIL